MSEAEKKKRQDYIRHRRMWIIVQTIIAVVLAINIALSAFAYFQLNKSHYVEYTEDGSAEFYVIQYDDKFYDDSVIDGGQAYVSELIKEITVFFEYELNMDASDVEYLYSYKVNGVLEVKNKDNDLLIKKTYDLVPETDGGQNSNKKLEINETVSIDFPTYNGFAEQYIKAYGLSNTKATFNVCMEIDVTGNSAKFENDQENSYFISLDIPLATKTTKISTQTSVPTGENKVLTYNNSINQNVFKASAVAASVLEIIVIIALIVFIFKSRNHDINYSIKVRRIVSAYKSYIQKITNEVDTSGYQLLFVETFREMLEIRDTISAPILMNENEDKTRTRFFILTNTKILYVFEIKIDNYDEIYGKEEKVEKEPKAEPKVVVLNVEPEIPEVIDEPIIKIEPTETEKEAPILAYLDNDGNKLDIRCSRSFEANLIQSDETVKDYYNELKNYIMSFKGVKSRFSWKFETFNKGRNPFFKIKLRGKTILLYCAIDPESIDKAKYRHDAIDNKLFADVPTLLKIKAGLNVRRAKEVIDLVMAKFEMEKNPKYEDVDYKSMYAYEENQALIGKGLIKVLADNEESKSIL